jgi:hypothetical protein
MSLRWLAICRYYNYEMEGVDFNYLSDVLIPDKSPRGRGRPDKVANDHAAATIQGRCQELTVMLGLADEERLALITKFRDQGRVLVALSSSRREMDELKIKAAALIEKR